MPIIKPKYMTFTIIEDYFNPSAELPTLYIDINPQTFSQTFKKKIHRYQTFNAFVEEFWGEELDNIACSASTGGFYNFEDTYDSGLTFMKRGQTPSYHKFKNLLNLFKNNGNIYDEYGSVIKKGNILLGFDNARYTGFFDTFDFTEDAGSPFRFVFNFSFYVEQSLTEI